MTRPASFKQGDGELGFLPVLRFAPLQAATWVPTHAAPNRRG